MGDTLRQPPIRQHHFQVAATHRVGAHGFRQQGDADAALGHRLHHREVEAGDARLQFDPAHLAIRAMQFPALAGVVLADAEGDVLGKPLRRFRPAGAIQVLRAGDQQLLDLAEAAHHQAAVVVQLAAHAYRDVHAFVDDVHPAVADDQLQADFRVQGHEFRQQFRELLLRHRHRHADPHRTARFRAQAIHRLARGLRLGQHRLRMAMHAGADIGHRETSGRALQQAHAEFALQCADAPAQARLGNAQRTFGRGETTVVDDGGEVVQVVEILHADNSVFGTYSGI